MSAFSQKIQNRKINHCKLFNGGTNCWLKLMKIYVMFAGISDANTAAWISNTAFSIRLMSHFQFLMLFFTILSTT